MRYAIWLVLLLTGLPLWAADEFSLYELYELQPPETHSFAIT